MNPVISKKERVFHAVLFELLAIVSSVMGLTIFTDHDVASLSGTLIVVAMIAMCWNVVFNWIFDQFATGPKEKRSVSLRIFHVIIFEAGLLFITVPVMAYLLETSMWNAFIMDLGVSIFITIYAFVYNLVYDHARAYICRTKQINEAVS